MKTAVSAAPRRRAVRAAVTARQIERFPREHRAVVRGTAMNHAALADLASSFPALLFHIALDPAGTRTVARQAIAGAPLKDLAAAAGVPLWTRKLPPEAFTHRLRDLPRGELISRQIGNFLPGKCCLAASWLALVTSAHARAHEGLALWVARHHACYSASVDRRRRDRPELSSKFCLWAWYSTMPGTLGYQLMERRWTPGITPHVAARALSDWLCNVTLHLGMANRPVTEVWLEPAVVDGFHFQPLITGAMIAEEAKAMRNCLRGYGHDVASDHLRLWSLRRDGRRIATLAVGIESGGCLLGIAEIRGPGNEDVPLDVAVAARRWLNGHELTVLARKPSVADLPFDRAHWQALWKPYWLAKRRVPSWLPVLPENCELF